jgi:hypothetical protein
MTKTQNVIGVILKVIALAMAIATIVLSILQTATVETYVVFLGIGLFTLALASLSGKTE